MSSLSLIRKLISPLLLLNIVRRYNGRSSLMKIKAAQAYVTGIKKTRIFFLGMLLVILSFVLLCSGMFLVHTALFTYSLWSSQTKFIAALVLGGIELAGAMVFLYYVFREETWAKFCGIQQVLDSVVEGKPSRKKERNLN